MPSLPTAVPVWSVLLGLLVSSAVGLFFGDLAEMALHAQVHRAGRAGGRDPARFESGGKIGHRTPLLLSVKAVDRLLEAGKPGNADPACGFTRSTIEA